MDRLNNLIYTTFLIKFH